MDDKVNTHNIDRKLSKPKFENKSETEHHFTFYAIEWAGMQGPKLL